MVHFLLGSFIVEVVGVYNRAHMPQIQHPYSPPSTNPIPASPEQEEISRFFFHRDRTSTLHSAAQHYNRILTDISPTLLRKQRAEAELVPKLGRHYHWII